MDLITLAVAKKYTNDKIAEAAVGGADIEEYVNARVDEVIGSASSTFDTLGEIETAVKNKVDKTLTINSKPLNANISLNASDVGAVPTSRTINGKGLSSNISLNASDVGALSNTTTLFSGDYNDLTNKPTIPSISGLATETYVDNAIANIVLTSDSGKRFKLSVDDAGALVAVEITE